MIPLFKVFMSSTAQREVGKVLESGFIGQGPKVEEFETELKSYLSNDYICTTNAATSAEHLALHLMKKDFISEGDEVLTTPLTCTATNWPILANGLNIKWVDTEDLLTYLPNTLFNSTWGISETPLELRDKLPDIIKGHVLYPEQGSYNIESWFHPISIYKKEILHQKTDLSQEKFILLEF